MSDKNDKKYSIYHYMYGNVSTTFDDGWSSRSKSNAPIFEGTKEQCYNWLKSQFIDVAATLAEIDAKVMIDFDDCLELQFVIRKYCDDDTRYYFRSMYIAEM